MLSKSLRNTQTILKLEPFIFQKISTSFTGGLFLWVVILTQWLLFVHHVFLVEASMTGSSKRASLGPWYAKWKWVHSFLAMKMFAFKQTDAGCTHIHKHYLQTFQQLCSAGCLDGSGPMFRVWFDWFEGSESLLPSRGTRENGWHGFSGTTSTAKVWATCCWQQHVAPSKCKAWRHSAWLSMH